MKKTLIALAVFSALACSAQIPQPGGRAPRGAPAASRGPAAGRAPARPAVGPQRAPAPAPSRGPGRPGAWGRGGANFLPGFAGGLVGSLAVPAARPLPPPPPPPAVIVEPVWVPPVYKTRPVYDAVGNIIRYEPYVVTPGYWR